MKHQPERTCIGCRSIFKKGEVVRIVAERAPSVSSQSGIVIDYREKLPGRAVYVCPRIDCIRNALSKDHLSKALRLKVKTPSFDEFIAGLVIRIEERIESLIAMSAKAGKLAAGYSAVRDAVEKETVEMLLFAQDISGNTRESVAILNTTVPHATLFTRDKFGSLLNRELIGVIAIQDKGFARALAQETERLNMLQRNDRQH